jgi:hypothetical protein
MRLAREAAPLRGSDTIVARVVGRLGVPESRIVAVG